MDHTQHGRCSGIGSKDEDDRFSIAGDFAILPGNSKFSISGELEGSLSSTQVVLRDSVDMSLLGHKLTGVLVELGNSGMTFKSELVNLKAQKKPGEKPNTEALSIAGSVGLLGSSFATDILIDPAENKVHLQLSADFLDLLKAIFKFDFAMKDHTPLVTGTANVNVPTLHQDILTGTVKFGNDEFIATGKFSLFPEHWPIKIAGGEVSFTFGAHTVAIRGDIETKFGPVVLGDARLSVDSQGFSISGTFLGQLVEARVQPSGVIAFDVKLGPIVLHVHIAISDNGQTKITYSSKFAGVEFDASFQAPSTSGSWTLKVFGEKLAGGDIRLQDDSFHLVGEFHLGPLHVSLSGNLGSGGLQLMGKGSVNLKIVKLTTTITINNGLPAVSASIEYHFIKWHHLAGVVGGIFKYRGKVSLCAEGTFHFIHHFHLYLWIDAHGLHVALKKPKDWPLRSSSLGTAVEVPYLPEADIPTLDIPILEIVDSALSTYWSGSSMSPSGRIADHDEQAYDEAVLRMISYDFTIESLDNNGLMPTRAAPFRILLRRSSAKHDLFTQIQAAVLAILAGDHRCKQQLRNLDGDQIMDVSHAEAAFQTKVTSTDSQTTKLALSFKHFGQGATIFAVFDFNDLTASYYRIAEQVKDLQNEYVRACSGPATYHV